MASDGVFYDLELKPLLEKGQTPSTLLQWEGNANLFEDEDFLARMSQRSTSFPPGYPACLHRPGWVPLMSYGADFNHVAIDLDPGPRGVVGQVIHYGRDIDRKHVLATSWAHFLEDIADELEAGNFALKGHRYGLFHLKKPRGMFTEHFLAWAKAKLPPDFRSR